MSMGITAAFAADYSITVTNDNTAMSIVGKQYKAYKVFDLTLGNETTTTTTDPETGNETSTTSYGAYAYSIKNTDWAWATLTQGKTPAANGAITTDYGIVLTPSAADPTVYVVNGDAMTDALARKLADDLEPVLPSSPTGSATATSESVTIDLTVPGYYAVYGVVIPTDPNQKPAEEVVAAVALTTTDPTADVKPKVSVPTLDKKIKMVDDDFANLLDDKGKAAVAQVGAKVSYEIDSTTPDLTGYDDYTYIISDTITSGLTYDQDSFALTINGTTVNYVTTATSDNDADVELIFNANGTGFTLTIPFKELSKYTSGKAVVLTYDCTVNSSALTYDYENNTANLEYSNSPYDDKTNHTPDKKTYVIDINIDVDKVAESASGTKLDGAEFKLYRERAIAVRPDDRPTTVREYYKWNATNNVVTWVDTQAAGDTFTTGTNGKLTTQVRGLDKGDYYLEETKAPEGYNLLSDPVKVSISVNESENKVTYTATTDGASAAVTNGVVDLATAQTAAQPVATATIVNNSGTVLPSTGGIGTTIFYVVGSIMVVAAGVLLITKKRMSREG